MVVVNMSISQKLDNCYENQINNIKKEKNYKSKILQIGALVLDVGGRCISAISKKINCSRKFIKKCAFIVSNDIEIKSNKDKCGRKKITFLYPDLENDVKVIIESRLYTDPHFETEQLFCSLTIDQVMEELLKTGKYNPNFISRSSLANLLNKLGYNLKKVKRNKPLKKIEETDSIFKNVNVKKEQALNEKNTSLISIDTKDKVLLGPYSRKGKSRINIEACDHELTNKCIIPFGILDLKTNKPYFYNFSNKPTSIAMVECIDDYLSDNSCTRLVILLDNGPDNSGRRTAFLKSLVDLSNKYQIEIELVYYPPYHSKYNPIERIWARLEMMWRGMLLISEEICNKVMEKLTWKKVEAKVKYIDKEYEKGVKYSKEVMNQYEGINIHRDNKLKKWSIVITPSI
jgi:hypothetical protein